MPNKLKSTTPDHLPPEMFEEAAAFAKSVMDVADEARKKVYETLEKAHEDMDDRGGLEESRRIGKARTSSPEAFTASQNHIERMDRILGRLGMLHGYMKEVDEAVESKNIGHDPSDGTRVSDLEIFHLASQQRLHQESGEPVTLAELLDEGEHDVEELERFHESPYDYAGSTYR